MSQNFSVNEKHVVIAIHFYQVQIEQSNREMDEIIEMIEGQYPALWRSIVFFRVSLSKSIVFSPNFSN